MRALHGLTLCLLLAPPCVTLYATPYATPYAAPYTTPYATPYATSHIDKDSSADLRGRADQASGVECARLSMQAARLLLEEANRLFDIGEVKSAHNAIEDSIHYVRRAVDCSVQTRKSEKNTEIELRQLIRRMKDIVQTLDSEDRPRVSRSVIELERQRDRLLGALFGAAAGGRTPEKKKP